LADVFSIQALIIFVLCYVIGSFPTAYLLVKAASGKDVTREGSGNVGTLNSFQVSRSKWVGITVLLTDLLKGLLPVYIMLFVLNISYAPAMIGASALILGHNYPVWLKFKGGRGLAAGAGIFMIVNFYILAGWILVWLFVFLIKRKVLIANTIATFSLPLIVVLINFMPWMVTGGGITGFTMQNFTIFSLIITLIILLRHTEVFKRTEKHA
jgi:glycerol-3-phosphate acyltransferase PlsY